MDGAPEGQAQAEGEQNVLYVQLPEGHPVITKSSEEEAEAETSVNAAMTTTTTELSLEEAIEQAEVVFDDDGITTEDSSVAAAVCQGWNNQSHQRLPKIANSLMKLKLGASDSKAFCRKF